jgi:hypothetical protein
MRNLRRQKYFLTSLTYSHHLHGLTWVKAHNVVYEPGCTPILVIFGAIAVGRKAGKGELVPDGLHIWDPCIKEKKEPKRIQRPKQHVNATGEMKRKKGYSVRVGSCWVIPDVVKNTGLVADNIDYHGNFNADIFENIFDEFCYQVCQN